MLSVRMFGRSFRIALLVVQALWLNVIVPGHRRGVIALPGEHCQDGGCQIAQLDGCCDMPGPSGKSNQSNDKRDPAQHCLICYFAARVTAPPVVDFTLPPLQLLEQLPPPLPAQVTSYTTIATYDGRAPPAAMIA